MPAKPETYIQMADDTANKITGSWQEWTSFLTTAARLYKYPYHEQLMIYAQRPDATACAEYDLWNNTMRRYVRRGAKGIALLQPTPNGTKIRYVFDASDTGGGENARRPFLWTIGPRHDQAVRDMLETAYDEPAALGLPAQLTHIAEKLATDYWQDHQRDILGNIDGSFLEGYDDFNVGVAFRKAAAVSISYALQSRCGLEPENSFDHDDFMSIFDWNTPAAVATLGTAVSEINQQVLRQIEMTVKNMERSYENERAELSDKRGLPDSRPDAGRNGYVVPGQVREDAADVSSGESPNIVQFPASVREADAAPAGDRTDGEPTPGADDEGTGAGPERDGGTESIRPNALGGADEQPESPGGRSDPDGADLRLTQSPALEQLSLFSTEIQQIQSILEAESAHAPFAFSFAQEIIDNILRLGSNTSDHRMEIATAFMKQKPLAEVAEHLEQLYHGGNGFEVDGVKYSAWYDAQGIRLARGSQAQYSNMAQIISWEDAAKRINEMMDAGTFATMLEIAGAPGHERKQLAESLWYLYHDCTENGREILTSLKMDRRTGFPEETAQLADHLADPEFVNPLITQVQAFTEARAQGQEVLRFRYHRLPEMLKGLQELALPRRDYSSRLSEMDFVQPFITDDEIDAELSRGSNVSGGKGRIHQYFSAPHSSKEKADFLKQEYGIGGRSPAFSSAPGSSANHDSKGVHWEKRDCPAVHMSWSQVAKRVDVMMRLGRYLIPKEHAQRTQTQVEQEAIDHALREWNGDLASKHAVVRYMREHSLDEDAADWLRQAYGDDMPAFPVVADGVSTDIPWTRVRDRLARLIHEDRFYTPEEQDSFDDTDPVAIRDTLAQRGIVDGKVVDKAALYQSAILQQVSADAERAAQNVVEDTKEQAMPVIPPIPKPPAVNFRITDDALGTGGVKTKYRYNVDAIRTLQQIETEGRSATPAEQETLSRYVGWGGIPQAFDDSNTSWTAEYTELKGLLSQEEYDMARASTLNAHYTSPTVIKAIFQAVERMGFTTGNVLEPACGVGNFFGLLPESMQHSRLYGVELDSITGRIASQLYPQANITISGFEKTDRRDFFDLAVGNVPFGSYKLSDRQYDKHNFLIHDYFFAKTLDQVRPGGVIAFITSKGTLDKQNPDMRRYIAQRAELLGAVRLPNNAFKANAGTEVTTDIIFLQKRERPIDIEPDWVHLGQTEDGIPVNSYYAEHPEMMLGQMVWDDSMYGNQKETACQPIEGADLASQLAGAMQHIHGDYAAAELPELAEGEEIQDSIPADPNVKNFSYTVVDGEVYYRENSVMVRPELNATARERIKGLVALRDCAYALIDAQLDEYSDIAIQARQQELNEQYDAFTAQHGLINSRGNANAFSDDSSYYLLCSLEVLDENGGLDRKADMFTKRTIKQQRTVEHVDTAAEALAVSISEKAGVDLPYMAQLTGKTEAQVTHDLGGVIFRLPDSPDDAPRYVTADEYLSGNVREKLARARDADALHPDEYLSNIKALEAAQPKDLDASEIDVRLGATWVDTAYIQQFMYETFDTPGYLMRNIAVHFSPYTAEWNISGKNVISGNNVAAYSTYGTDRANAYRILEDTLNLRDIRIYDTVLDADGKEKRVLNQKATTLAQQKQQAIKDAFSDWIWKDADRRQTLVQTYNERFNSTRTREYDGSHIAFGGMSPEIVLREHQRSAVAHILYGGNTLLAHEVGAGKTFEMVAAAMESKRLGLCQKSMFAVPNHLTEQWASEFLRLYPSANILVTTKKDFEKRNRRKFCARIATGDYDAVIIGHSQFERIPISQERQERLLQQQISEITQGIAELKANDGERFSVKQLERTRKQLEDRLKKLQNEEKKDDVITFEQLGVDRLYVDEAHTFKNLFLYTKMRNVAGLSTSEAQKSSDMFMKCRYMDELTGGRGIIFATGTPVSNSMTELYTMQRYLQYHTLEKNRLTHFDAWASTFGETTTAIELAPEGTGYRARTRFAKFFNLPELMTLFREVADIKTADQLNLPTPKANFDTVVVKPSEYQQEMVQALSKRAAEVHSGIVDPRDDNMLKITSDGRKLGLDQRLINPLLPDDPQSKVNACVGNIHRIWEEGQDKKLTQLVFCDISTPKGAAVQHEPSMDADAPKRDFNVYDDIRAKLIANGIPPEQIAYIHDANTEARKKELFAKVRSGQVRVLMGSTAKMGAGTNIQDRLVALHDLDCPWRPGDLEQRAGRIVRQGNQNPEVHIFRYVTEGTFDAYLWQTVENKQKFISQIMTSKSPVRACEDVDETALSYAEIKALCAGDPRIKEKMDLDVDVARLRLMKADHMSKQYRLEDQLLKYFPQEIEKNNGYIAGFQQDIATLDAHPVPEKAFVGMEIGGVMLMDKEKAGKAILEACKEAAQGKEMEVGSYRGLSMSLAYDSMFNRFMLTLRGEMSYRIELGNDVHGNLTRIDNGLAQIPSRLEATQAEMDNLQRQMEAAKQEVTKPFPQEGELQTKSARLAELDASLNLGGRSDEHLPEKQEADRARPSVLESLKTPCRAGAGKKHIESEVR